MEKLILGCDWGTSSFRMRLFDLALKKVIGEVVSEEGIASMHKAWHSLDKTTEIITKVDFFKEYLKKEIALLAGKLNVTLDQTPIVISGMASSSIGMEDVPYANLPFALDGSDTAVKHLQQNAIFPHDILLVSGVCSENDVMRGEETQLIGLLALLEKAGAKPTEGILIFPGTHSKHNRIKSGSLITFNTFMTGELFSLMSKYSILKDSVQKDDAKKLSEEDATAFKLGVQKSKESGILNGLFTVRTNQLFDKLDKKQNAFYLSGLLIGEELNYLLKNDGTELVLCSASNLGRFYMMAIEALNLSGRTHIVSTELVDESALAGQILLFEKHILNTEAR